MKTQYPLLRPALWLHRCRQQRSVHHDQRHKSALDTVQYHAELLIQHLKASRHARSRDWHAALALMDLQVAEDLQRLQYSTTEAQSHPSPITPQPTLRDIYEELLQLQQEFVKVTLEPKQFLLAAVTDAIELEGIYLGEFRLELHIDRLNQRADVSAFDIVALDPHPPERSNDVTHPHVRDNQLCAGDATRPIAQALKDGRFCDAFLAVNSVLHQYNASSPYVSLENWQGLACADCGCPTGDDERYYCEDCGQDYCGECYSTCDICQASFCHGCLEEDKETGKNCCRSCRQHCKRCGRMVDADSFDEAAELCPGCLKEKQQSEPPIQQTEEMKDEQRHEHTTDSRPKTACIPEPV